MGNAYGFIEITGVVAAIDVLDIMCKAAEVSLASWERKLGGRLVTLVVEGNVSAVKQAIEAGVAGALKKPVASGILPNPHPEVVRMVELSASRFKGKTESSSIQPVLTEDAPDSIPKEKRTRKK